MGIKKKYKSYYEYDFKIFITDWKKKLRMASFNEKTPKGTRQSIKSLRIGRLWTAIGYYRKYIEKSTSVYFPSIYVIKKGSSKGDVAVKKNEEVILCTRRSELSQHSLPKWIIDGMRDNLGREVILESSHPDWIILHASPWREEEIFPFYHYDNPKKYKRLKFLDIYDKIVEDENPKFISYFRNKIYIMDNNDKLCFLITKCESDSERFISVLQKKLYEDKSKVPIVFLGQLTEENLKVLHEYYMSPIFNKSLMYMRIHTKEYINPKTLKEDKIKKNLIN